MADNNVEIKFSAETKDARGEIEQLQSSLEGFASPIRSAIDRFKQLEQASKSLQASGRSADMGQGAADQASTSAKLAEINYRRTQEALSAELKLHLITYDQETAALIAALDQRHKAQAAAGRAGQGSDAKYPLEREKLLDHQIEQDVKEWQSVLQPIQSAWDSQLRKLLAGGETFGQAMKHVFADLTIKFIESVESMVVRWLAAEAAKTAATLTGNAARTASDQAAGAQGVLTSIGAALKSIFASVGVTTAEVTANVAPVAGPAAPAIGMAAGATTLGAALAYMGQYDVGGYVLETGLGVIHKGETIVPARVSTPYGGPGDASGDTHVHNWSVSAIDPASFQRWLGAGGARQIARAVSAVQARSPSMSW